MLVLLGVDRQRFVVLVVLEGFSTQVYSVMCVVLMVLAGFSMTICCASSVGRFLDRNVLC